MKNLLCHTVPFLVAASVLCRAQTIANPQTTILPPPTEPTIASRDSDARVWAWTEYQQGPTGQAVPVVHQYTELASGLCYQQNGQWMDSQEQINIQSDGSAEATQGQHQAYFPSDIYKGPVTLVTPDGLHLQSEPLGLSYDDGTNTVFFAVLTNSVGELINSNQIIYPNAFVGVDADLIYTYKKSGFEQDVVFRQQPPAPEQFGFASTATRLQLITEFFNPPTPKETTGVASPQDSLQDTTLSFGSMKMVRGHAFVSGNTNSQNHARQASVYKSWINISGRNLLVEQLPYQRISPNFSTLPPSSPVSLSSTASVLFKISSRRLLPPARVAEVSTNTVKLAKAASVNKSGVVLDYITMDSGETNFTFQADMTYDISEGCYLEGTTVFEGGAVIKFEQAGSLETAGDINCLTGPYRPAVFTSRNDDTLGEIMPDSSSWPDFQDVDFFWLVDEGTLNIHDMRFSYAEQAIIDGSEPCTYTLENCQALNVGQFVNGYDIYLYNVLIGYSTNEVPEMASIENCQLFVDHNLVAENVTADSGYNFITPGGGVALTNCLITGENLYDDGADFQTNAVYYLPSVTNSIYQVVGGGNYYLARGSPYRGHGTTNIDPALLASLSKRTTWPPIVYDVTNITLLGTLTNAALRDTNVFPDVGYHYDALDFVFGGCDLYSNLTVAAGTAVGWFEDHGAQYGSIGNTYGMSLNNGIGIVGNISFNGTATQPCYLVPFKMVQEGGNGNWPDIDWNLGLVYNGNSTSHLPGISANFVILAATYGVNSIWGHLGSGTFKNCEFYDSAFESHSKQLLAFTNCLFFREPIYFWANDLSFVFENDTFYNCGLWMYRTGGAGFWQIENSSFDDTAIYWSDVYHGASTNTLFDHNAYNTNNTDWQNYYGFGTPLSNKLETVASSDIMVTNYNWQTNFFGNFYLPWNSQLITNGNASANLLGLYHFTTQTNQIPNGTNRVDIGYHYVATDASGNPFSTPGNGYPDYLADTNGNGIDDPTETPWDIGFQSEPRSTNIAQGLDVTFSTTVGGIGPFTFQWYLNGTNIPGATSSNYTVQVVQYSYDHYAYSVIVSNATSHITSTNAILGVEIPVANTNDDQPTNQTVAPGVNVSFSVAASGNYLAYQWYYANGTPINNGSGISGATNNTLTISNVDTSDTGGYYAVVANLFNAITSRTAELTVLARPNFATNLPSSENITQSEDLTLTFDVTNPPPLSFQWFFSNSINTNIQIGADSIYSQLVVQTNNTGLYSVTATNLAGSTNGSTYLTVLVPAWITQQPATVATNAGATVKFTSLASGTTNLYYQWFENGTSAISWATNASLTLTNVQMTNAGGYSVIVSNIAGTSMSAWAWLSITNGSIVTNGWGTGTQPSPPPVVSMIWPTNASPMSPYPWPYGIPIHISALATNQYSYVTNVVFYFATNLVPGTNFTFAGTAVPGPNGIFALAWSNAVPGTNVLEACAYNCSGISTTSTLVYVLMTQSPTVWAGQSTNLIWEEGMMSITDAVSGVITSNGQPNTLTGYSWSANGPGNVFFSPTTSTNPLAIFSTNGDYNVTFTASNGYRIGSLTFPVHIRRRPQVSVTFPTNNAAITIGTPTVLIATATSVDSTVTNVTFYTNSVAFVNPATASITNSFRDLLNTATNYTCALTAVAIDGYGLQNTSGPVIVNIYNPYPYVQITSPLNQTFYAYSNVTITVFATNSTFAAPIDAVQIFANGNSLGYAVSTNNNYQIFWMPFDGGTNFLIAEAIETKGLTGWSQYATNFVIGLPIVAITSPSANANLGSMLVNIPITASVTTAFGASVTNVSYYKDGFLIGTNLSGPYTITWPGVTNGIYTLLVTATDIRGGVGLSANVTVTVEPSNQPPFVYAGPNEVTNMPSIQLAGFASDDGLPSNYLITTWSSISNPPGATANFGNSNALLTTATFSTNGNYVFRLTASDGSLMSTSQVSVTVLITNKPPVVFAGPGQTLILPAVTEANLIPTLQLGVIETLPFGGFNSGGWGLAYFSPSNCLVVCENAATNFALIHQNGSFSYFSSIGSLGGQEIDMATVRNTVGGFTNGEIFCAGEGMPGAILRIEPDGTTLGTNFYSESSVSGSYTNYAWVILPDSNVVMSVWVDDTGVWGGDLIVLESTACDNDPYNPCDEANVWRVNSKGQSSFVTHLTGGNFDGLQGGAIATVPDNMEKYGPWAGRVLIDGANTTIFAVDTNGSWTTYDFGTFNLNPGQIHFGSSVEDIRIIPENENLYGVGYGPNYTEFLWGAPASQFQGMAGDILISEENSGNLFRTRWNGSGFDIYPIGQIGTNISAEQLNFAPAGLLNVPLANYVQLRGAVADDGNLFSPTSNLWFQVSGAGPVTFDCPTLTNTIARFTEPGTNYLDLAAFDGQFTSYSNIEVQVIRNQAPVVNAGTNQIIATTNTIVNTHITDDGWPSNQLTITWAKISGPANPNFAWQTTNTTSTNFNATNSIGFPIPGSYVLSLAAFDGQATSSTNITITVKSPGLTLSPSFGWPTRTNTQSTFTATLVDQNGQPMGPGSNIIFGITSLRNTGISTWTTNSSTDSSGNASMIYTSPNVGQDFIQASNALLGVFSTPVIKYWGDDLECGAYVSGASLHLSWAIDWPTNDAHYADYYLFDATAGSSFVLNYDDPYSYDAALILRDPSNNIVGASVNGSLSCMPLLSGDYLIEVADPMSIENDIANDYSEEPYDLSLSCGTNTSAYITSPQIQVLFGGANLPSGSTITFPTTTPGFPTNLSLIVTNPGTADLVISNFLLVGDFTTNISDQPFFDIPAGSSTNLHLIFNASSNETSVGDLFFQHNVISQQYNYVAYLVGNAFPTGVPPNITLTAPANKALYSAPARISFVAQTTSTSTNINYVDFRELTSDGIVDLGRGTMSVFDTNSYTLNVANVPAGNYTLTAVAVDSAGRSSAATPVTVQVGFSTNQLPVAVDDQFTVIVNSQNNQLDVLSNDYDLVGNPLSIVAIQPPNTTTHGTATIINGGSAISYAPYPGIQGYPADGFSYEISDGLGGTAWAGVQVNVFAGAAPNITFANPSDGYTTNAGSLVPLVAYVTPTQYISNVTFYQGQTAIAVVTNGVNGYYTTNWIAVSNSCDCGFTAQATDIFGQIATSQPEIHINVIPPANGALIAVLTNIVSSSGTHPLTSAYGPVTIRDGVFQLYGQAFHSMGSNVVWQLGVYTSDGSTLLRNLTPAVTGPVGTTNIDGIILTNCDLTTLDNGVYDLRLTVAGGYLQTSTDVQFILESNLKIGQFSFSQQDLIIPVNGIPLTVTRSYNSQDPHEGDFGYGWTYTLSDMNVVIDEVRQQKTDKRSNTYSIRIGGNRDVTLTLPNGQRTTFYYNPRYSPGTIQYYPQWQVGPGAPPNTTLVPGPNSAQVEDLYPEINGQQPYWEDLANHSDVPDSAYDFPSFILTTSDGTKYLLGRQNLGAHPMSGGAGTGDTGNGYTDQAWGTPYLAKIIERNSNTINFATNAITFNSPSGATNHILIQRNGLGFISSIGDPNSIVSGGPPAVKYEYDNNGNLIYVERLINSALATYATNSFAYTNANFPHFITSMFNGDGTQVARNYYDDTGKLIETIDASGNTTYFNNNLTNNSETVVDRLGNTNVYVYDTRGNVIVETDPLNETTTSSYDSNNNLLSTTDPLTNTTSYAYDSNNNRIRMVDTLGHTNFFNYDGTGDLTGQSDPLGNTTTNFYDSSGDLIETEQLDTNGNVIQTNYSTYQNGQITQTLNGNNQVTGTFAYDPSSGYLTSSTDANGLMRTFGYDANGNQTNSFYVYTPPGGPSTSVNTYTVYDGQNRVVMTIDANGNTNQTFYDLNGKVSYTVDKFGNTNSFLYDARGNQIESISALGTVTYTVYDLDSRPIVTTDPNGITGTLTQYDAVQRITSVIRLKNVQVSIVPDPNAPGQMTSITDSLGIAFSTNSTTYFANGWVKSRTSPDGTTTYAYYANGQTESVTDPLTNTTYYAYDSAGHQSQMQDALSHTTRFKYDAAGRQIETIFNDMTTASNEFNSVGQRIGTVDQSGLVTQFAYNVAGSLTNVIKPQVPLGTPSWSYQYNTNGQLVTTTDPKSHTTTNYYDALNRQLGQSLPMGQINTQAVYNVRGQLWKEYDFNGQTVEHRYDNFGRQTNKYYFTAGATMPTYSVSYAYDKLNQLTNVTQLYGSMANSSYQPLARNGDDIVPVSPSAKWMASLNRSPNLSSGLTVTLMLAFGMAMVSREKRRRFALALWGEWQTSVQLLWDHTPSHTKPKTRSLRPPSLFWRFASVVTMLAVLANQPGADRLWTAHGQCVYPPNFSNTTTRITSYSYDFDGHVTQVNSPEGVINYAYDLATDRMTLLCTTNSEQDYAYDALGRLYTVTVAKRNNVAVTNETTLYHYDQVGNRSEVDLPNGVVTTYKYDSLNRLTNMVHEFGTTNLATYSYVLNAAGRRSNALEVLRQEDRTYQTNTLAWQFDGLYRLTNEVNITTSPAGTYAYTNAYAYDLVGNRLQKSRSGASAETDTYTYNANDELTNEMDGSAAINYLYDLNGSLTNQATGATTNSYAYDVANKLNAVSVNGTQQAGYYYNDQGIRVRTTTPPTGSTTYFLIDDNNLTGYSQVLEELPTVGGTPTTSYAIGDDVLAQCGSTSTSLYYYLQDGHGNNRQLWEMNGTIFSHYTYDSYGNVQMGTVSIPVSTTSADTASTTKLYCAEQYDSYLKMYNLRARFYDSLNGRFSQRDIFIGNNDDPMTLHKYLYANSDPINAIDPTGEMPQILITIAIVVIWLVVLAVVADLVHELAQTRFAGRAPTAEESKALGDARAFIKSNQANLPQKLVKFSNIAMTATIRVVALRTGDQDIWGQTDPYGNLSGNTIRVDPEAFKLDKRLLASLLIHESVHTTQWSLLGGEKEAFQAQSDAVRAWRLEDRANFASNNDNNDFIAVAKYNFSKYDIKNPVW